MSALSLHLALLRILRLAVCPMDGKRKDPGKCFCKTCYFSLSRPLQLGLYTSALDGDEFYDNYVAAIDFLDKRGLFLQLSKITNASRRAIEDTGLREALKQHKTSKGITA